MDVFDLAAKISLDTSPFEKGLDRAKGKMSAFGDVFKANIASDVVSKGFSAITNGVTKAVGGLKTLVSESTSAFGEYQQMVGGVQKLYGNMGKGLDDYAAAVGKKSSEVRAEWERNKKAEQEVLADAKNAYKEAGMSANQYMNIATQFSASLISSLGGNTKKAADQTKKAMVAISDNVNTFGSNMEDVTNAFKGFSKQNYTMLDNLKLGYGGNKTEMKHLVEDANEYAKSIGQAGDLSMDSFSDIVSAIELIQEKQHIAGTTAREAATTLQGSMQMVTSAWENLKTSIGSGEDLETNVDNLIDSIVGHAASAADVAAGTADKVGDHVNGLLDNLLPTIETSLKGIGTLVEKASPIISKQLPGLIEAIVPPLLKALGTLTATVIKNLPKIMKSIGKALSDSLGGILDPKNIGDKASGLIKDITKLASDFLQSLNKFITENKDELSGAITAIVDALIDGIVTLAPELTDAAVAIVGALGEALINAVPKLAKSLPKFVSGMMDAITDAWSKASPKQKVALAAVLAPIFKGGITDAIKGVQGAKDIVGKGKDIFTKLFGSKDTIGMDSLYGFDIDPERQGGAISKIGDKIKGIFSKFKGVKGTGADEAASAIKSTGKVGDAIKGSASSFQIPDPKTILKGLADIAIIIGGMTALITAIGAFMQIPALSSALDGGIDAIKKTFTGIADIAAPLAVVGAVIAGMGKYISPGTTGKGLADMAIIIGGTTGVITAIGAVMSLGSVEDFLGAGINTMVRVFTGLEQIMTPLAAFSALLAGIGLASPAAILSGLAGFTLVVGGLEGVLAALGGLSQVPGFDWIVNEGGQALIKLADTLGQVAGAFAGGALSEVSESFPEVGKNLGEFMSNAQPFFTGLGSVGKDSMESASQLAKVILAITAADVLNGLTAWLTGGSSFVDFGKQIAQFGPYLSQYASSVKGIDEGTVKASTSAAKSLAEMANKIPNSGGLASLFAGDNGIAKWGKQLPKFGKSLKEYADSVKGVDSESVTASANAGKALAEMSKSIPNSGGIAGLFKGKKSSWSKELPKIGQAIADYAKKVAGISLAKVQESATAFKVLVSASKSIPSSANGGIAAELNKYFDGMIDKLKEAQSRLVSTINDMRSSVSSASKPVGKAIVDGVWEGMSGSQGSLDKKVRSFFRDILKSAKSELDIHSPSKVMRDQVGVNISLGVARGIEKGEKKAVAAATGLANRVVKSARDVVLKSTKGTEAYAASLYNSIDKVKTTGTGKNKKTVALSQDVIDANYLKTAKSKIKELEDANKISEQTEASFWVAVAKRARKGSLLYSQAMAQANKILTESRSARFEKAEETLSEYKNLHDVSAKYEATYWKKVMNTFARGTKERLKAEKNYNSALKEISAERLEQYQKVEQNYAALHKGREMNAASEVAYWKNAKKDFKKGTDEWITVQTNYLNKRKELMDSEKSANDNFKTSLQNAEQTYQQAIQATIDKLNDRKQALLQQFGLFQKFDAGEAVAGSTLLSNIDSQVKGLKEWEEQIAALKKRMGNTDLFKAIQEQGASGLNEVIALNAMTDEELQTYSNQYEKLDTLAEKQAKKELGGTIKKDEQKALKDYMQSVSDAWKSYQSTMSELGVSVKKIPKSVKNSLKKVGKDYADVLDTMKYSTENKISAVASTLKNGFKKISGSTKKYGEDLMDNFIKGINSKEKNLSKAVIEKIAKQVKKYIGFSEPEAGPLSNFHTFAPDMIDLFVKGISENGARIGQAFDDNLGIEDISGRIAESMAVPQNTVGFAGIPGLTEMGGQSRQSGPTTLNITMQVDKTAFAKLVYQMNRAEKQRVGVNLATGVI